MLHPCAESTELAEKVFAEWGDGELVARDINKIYPRFQYYVHKFLKETVLIRHQRGTPHQSAIYQFSPRAIKTLRGRLT